MTIGVYRQRDGLVPHHLLYYIRVCALHRHPRAAGVPQAMEIGGLALVVHIDQEITLLSLGVFLGVFLRLFQPLFPGVACGQRPKSADLRRFPPETALSPLPDGPAEPSHRGVTEESEDIPEKPGPDV